MRLQEAASYACSNGVALCVEPLNRYETDIIRSGAEAIAFVEQVGHPGVGVLLDTYHMNIEEASWTAPFRQAAAAGLLFHVHVGDNNRLPPGIGLIDFSGIICILREVDYSGYLSAELLAKPDPDTAASQTARYLWPLIESPSDRSCPVLL